ncbi:MAG: hypothetical protein JNG85_07235 [Spirochaetaceae bacterium]|nr:hypothetical protein [Spirochaetaceae bacterium]
MNENFDREKACACLAETVAAVFADMAFIDAVTLAESIAAEPAAEPAAATESAPASSRPGPSSEVLERCALDVLKPVSCRLELALSPGLHRKIVEILLGESDVKGGADDSILEMLNVIAGGFLTSYFGLGVEIKLELPRYLFLEDESGGDIVCSADFDAEGERLSAILRSIRYRY